MTRWRPGSRVSRIRASHSYGLVLLMVVVSFVFAASAPDASWSQGVLLILESGTLMAALWTSGLGQDYRPAAVLGVVLVAVSLLAAVGVLAGGGDTVRGLAWLFGVVLILAIAGVIGLGILDQGKVNRQSVTGAISVYVLIGLIFTFVYGAVAALGSGPFFTQGTDGTLSVRLYFSYVTLATLGYGDYTPSGNLGHTLAIVEALFGQLYLVTVVALLVSNIGRTRRENP